MVAGDEFAAQFPGTVGGIGEHPDRPGFAGEECDADRGVTATGATGLG
ncbi:hypothetical protein BH09ACT8_BH09ACT8_18090 [soil metagenome]